LRIKNEQVIKQQIKFNFESSIQGSASDLNEPFQNKRTNEVNDIQQVNVQGVLALTLLRFAGAIINTL